MERPVGIDLGTTISVLAAVDDGGRVSFAATRDGGPRLRSVVAVGESGVTVGEQAVRAASVDPDSTFAFFKRSMGTDWEVDAGGRLWSPEDLSAEVLRALIEDAGTTFGTAPRRAVLTIPAYFGDDARRATRVAAERAEVEALALIHEPTAACFAHGATEVGGTVLVYDLGGGTFDVSVVRHGDGESEVLATLGDHRLGGKDWDDAMVELLVESLDGESDPRDDPILLAELAERAREAKHALSRLESCVASVPTADGLQRVEVTRAKFLERTAHLFDRTEGIVTSVVEEVGGGEEVDEVLLVGGSTRMTPCAEIVERAVGALPRGGVDPDEAVARGAAIFAAGIEPGGAAAAGGAISRIRDVTAHGLGFVVVSAEGDRYVNQVMIDRNAPIPASSTKAHSLTVPSGGNGSLEVHMLQGEAPRPLDNQPLGCWRFERIAAAKRGRTVTVEVSYEYDRDGIVQVAASADGRTLEEPSIDRQDRDLGWTDEEPGSHVVVGDLAVVLVIDVSASMRGSRLEEAKAAVVGFVEVLADAGLGDRIGLVAFSNSAERAARIGTKPGKVKKAAEALGIGGGTDMEAGLKLAEKELKSESGRRVVVVLTDGMPDDRAAALRVREALVQREVDIIARGVAGADIGFLEQLATVDGEILDLADLAGGFRGIARQLAGAGAGTGLSKR
ncbi:MAG TPA: Hsp70 family protein [Solirubrobacterales bacterium]|nr:Hsp70 family protein [Solirubrobacterales bacterium]